MRRFTSDGLRRLCAQMFGIREVSTSIGAWSALAFVTETVARTTTRNRFVGPALAWLLVATSWPLRFAISADHRTAGALLLNAQTGGAARPADRDGSRARLEAPAS